MTFVSPLIAENDLFYTMCKCVTLLAYNYLVVICTILPDALSDSIYFSENI